ncbi:prepilin-type N-terminal cleavage/methylation domain-containing protein [Dyella solisilvae]|uniref:Type II secretion system protein H n=1 Tax=Dyella solisilvae TaxID=1920168 RepID=A0A370KEY9_9GAMM|nr:GspH/FimT family pseudopilin [Dyella solisilvae]RDJ00671.1 prepilin-type N-terminal cleavage/methylation domain-containing protein [Dyella solisilvae]
MRGVQQRDRRHGGRGFTLMEQVVVMVMAATLACLAAPALGKLAARSRLQTAQSALLAALQQTRGVAIHTRQRAMLCPTRDGQHCSDELHWEGGWLVGHYRSDHADQLTGPPSLSGEAHDQLTILSSTGRRRIRFQADGSAGGSNVSFTLCRRGDIEGALAITVANSGRILGSRATPDQARRCAQEG